VTTNVTRFTIHTCEAPPVRDPGAIAAVDAPVYAAADLASLSFPPVLALAGRAVASLRGSR
jgi:hypothetical protein